MPRKGKLLDDILASGVKDRSTGFDGDLDLIVVTVAEPVEGHLT